MMKAKGPSKSPQKPVRRMPSVQDARFNQLALQLGVPLKELAPLLQISESTLHRFRKQTHLKGPTAERIELLQGIIQHGLRVYGGDAEALRAWLRYPLGELDGKTPLQSLTTIAGFTQVDDVLGRIEHGIFF
ncbi:antitoxin Xre/MbcA/ParS toxin-binding domain-containing protein [Persicitalea jodogahamensis]|uniref:Antitoxin Xre/MbcA/ParS-like toxin-binding domain-containing protein n=1 Tax=Persicitalea jodogahamensis TaxID=402147 RepID=A0A8J3DAH7_9BACT|nr:antitoxin Xre/MbcA/ParS toxin-binding domain-containing protein [Persicitalea jodogahamensis]GHB74966.1 hypothetical protein GCM10007390_30830 [Persicitalea jodogahamensis]